MDGCDVIVVGGGPGGSSCARHLHQAGLKVTVIDRQRFPRDKTCAGWVTPAVIETLDIDTRDYARGCPGGRVFQPITGFRVSRMGDAEAEVHYPEPVSYGILRREFDHYLLNRSGAKLHEGEGLKSLQREGGRWVVNGTFAAPMLIGAGGHYCPIARHLGVNVKQQREALVAAQEVEFELDPEQQAECRVEEQVPELFFTRDLKGYGWCFRKGGYINIGLGRQDNHRLSDHVQNFIEDLQRHGRIPSTLPKKFKGHAYLLCGESNRRLADDGVVLVGDAAGLAYARSGEGIRPAIESGILAAQTVLDASGDYSAARLSDYQRRLETRFGPLRDIERGGLGRFLPAGWLPAIAGKLLAMPWFVHNQVVDRWFLHREQAPLAL